MKFPLASGLPSGSAGTGELSHVFIPEVDRRLAEKGHHTIVWTTGRGGAIANQFELFEAIEDGLLTPPLGIAVFVIKTNPQDTDITLNDIFTQHSPSNPLISLS